MFVDQQQIAIFTPDVHDRRQPRTVQSLQMCGLVFHPHQRAGMHRVGRNDFDHYRVAVVDAAPRVSANAIRFAQTFAQLVPRTDDSVCGARQRGIDSARCAGHEISMNGSRSGSCFFHESKQAVPRRCFSDGNRLKLPDWRLLKLSSVGGKIAIISVEIAMSRRTLLKLVPNLPIASRFVDHRREADVAFRHLAKFEENHNPTWAS